MHGCCLCGAIRFEVDGPFPLLYQCHCSLCRKQGGSVSNTGLIIAADKFRWIEGEVLVSQWVKSSGFRSWFCSRCGAPVPNPLRDTGYIWVPSGLLEGDGPLAVGAQLYVNSKAAWDKLPDGGMHFETAPGLLELIEQLQKGASGLR